MGLIRMAGRRLRAILGRRALDDEMREELRFHYEMAVEDAVKRGIPLDEARREARREFGAPDGVAEAYRDARGTRWVEMLARDARYAVRSLRAAPAFTATAIGTLALGIGATTAVFSVVHGVLIRPLPYAEPGDLVIVWETDRDSGTEREEASVPDYFDYRERNRSLEALSAYSTASMNVTGSGLAERVQAATVTRGFFELLGVMPLSGRLFNQQEDSPGGPPAVLLSERYWRSRFGGAAAIGSSIRLDDSLYTVVGVMPRDVRLPTEQTDLWIPSKLTPASFPRTLHNVTMLGRLASGMSVAVAQREMDGLAAALEREYPGANNARGINIESLDSALLGQVRPALLVILTAVALVLLIACVNSASLLLSRRAARAAEVALRAALGASRARLAQQFFVESLILTLTAAAIGMVLAFGGVRVLVAMAPDGVPRLDTISVEPLMLVWALGTSIVVAMAFGLLPAAGGHSTEPADTLKGASSRGGGRSRKHRRLRTVLVTSEIALSLVLAISASLLIRSFAKLHAVDPGFESRRILSVRYQLPTSRYPQRYDESFPASWSQVLEFQREVIDRVSALPGVASAAIGASDPMDAGFANSFVIVGREAEAQRGQAEIATRSVSTNYFATVGVPLIRGRQFNSGDDAGSPPVVMINQAFADRYFSANDPVGHEIRFWGVSRRVVGVVGNELFNGLGEKAAPAMYPPISQAPAGTASLLVRAREDPATLVPAVRQVIAGLDDGLAVFRVRTMDDAIAESVARQRFLMQLVGGFAAAALLLAMVGVYGIVAYSVAQRRHEFGVRIALGATSRQVTVLMVNDGLRLAVAGLVLGAIGAFSAGKLLSSQLFAVSATDPAAFLTASAAVVLAVLLASYLPARKAGEVSFPGQTD